MNFAVDTNVLNLITLVMQVFFYFFFCSVLDAIGIHL